MLLVLLSSILVLKALTIQTANMENGTTNRAQMSIRQCIKARLQYLLRRLKLVKWHYEPPILWYLFGFPRLITLILS